MSADPLDLEAIERNLEWLRRVGSNADALEALVSQHAPLLCSEVRRLRERKDEAYTERNQVVAALSKLFPAHLARTAIEGWDPEWHWCVYIMLPTGQVSWHLHESHRALFAHLSDGPAIWDGHSTEEKYARLAALETP